jgi:uncharacterized protein YoaH (UPF0181 family)
MKVICGMFLAVALVSLAFAQAPSDKEIKARQENQQDLIAHGIDSGQLITGEAAKLEKQESNINKEIAKDRTANGGNLTNKQKAQVNRQS